MTLGFLLTHPAHLDNRMIFPFSIFENSSFLISFTLYFYSLFLCTSNIIITSSYAFNRFYALVLHFSLAFQTQPLFLSFYHVLLIYHVQYHSADLLFLCCLFQPKVILFLINHEGKLVMTNIRIYQCFKYFFPMLFNLLLANKAIFLSLCVFFLPHCFQEHFSVLITDEKH